MYNTFYTFYTCIIYLYKGNVRNHSMIAFSRKSSL